MVSRK